MSANILGEIFMSTSFWKVSYAPEKQYCSSLGHRKYGMPKKKAHKIRCAHRIITLLFFENWFYPEAPKLKH